MKYDIHHRWTDNVIFTAEIDCDESASESVKLGLAVMWAEKVRANLTDADLTRADLTRANLWGAELAGANLADAYLAGANLARANLTDADLVGANLARANLAGVDLTRANLTDAYLWGAELAGANLTRANLARANLTRADLWGANLARANLTDANLVGANLARANLAGVDLVGANLARASGNMAEVRSMQVDRWAVTWTTSFDGEVIIQIGCQRHPLRLWEKSDPRWIAAMDGRATEWWAKWREPLLAIVKANPAVPFGQAVRPKEHGETPEEVGQ